MALTDKQAHFISFYLGEARFNATKAAELAGYKDPHKESWRVRQHPEVQAAIEERVSQYAMSAEEVLAELTDIARMNMADVITVPPVGRAFFDFGKAEKNGKLGYIKKLSYTENGPSVELWDKQAALVQIGKFWKLWVDKVEQAVSGDLVVRVEYEDHPDAGNGDIQPPTHTTDTEQEQPE